MCTECGVQDVPRIRKFKTFEADNFSINPGAGGPATAINLFYGEIGAVEEPKNEEMLDDLVSVR